MGILRAGSTGIEVERLQLQLRRLGLYDGAVTGRMGTRLVKAVQAYETANGLRVDGCVNAKEAAQIKKASLVKTSFTGLERGDHGLRVEDVQRDLKGLGFYKGKLSGRFDAATLAAVKTFERTNKLKHADGVADLGTEKLLDRKMAGIDGAKHPNVQPPPSDYHRVVFRGGLMNVRTKVMLERAELYWAGNAAFTGPAVLFSGRGGRIGSTSVLSDETYIARCYGVTQEEPGVSKLVSVKVRKDEAPPVAPTGAAVA